MTDTVTFHFRPGFETRAEVIREGQGKRSDNLALLLIEQHSPRRGYHWGVLLGSRRRDGSYDWEHRNDLAPSFSTRDEAFEYAANYNPPADPEPTQQDGEIIE